MSISLDLPNPFQLPKHVFCCFVFEKSGRVQTGCFLSNFGSTPTLFQMSIYPHPRIMASTITTIRVIVILLSSLAVEVVNLVVLNTKISFLCPLSIGFYPNAPNHGVQLCKRIKKSSVRELFVPRMTSVTIGQGNYETISKKTLAGQLRSWTGFITVLR